MERSREPDSHSDRQSWLGSKLAGAGAVALGAVTGLFGPASEATEREPAPLEALVAPMRSGAPGAGKEPAALPSSDLRLFLSLSSGQLGPVIDAHLQLQARTAALDAIAGRVPLERSALSHHAPGLVEAEARIEGRDVRLLAVGGALFEMSEARSAAQAARLEALDREIARLAAEEKRLIAGVTSPSVLRQDLEILKSERSLAGIDLERLAPAQREELEAIVNVMRRRDSLGDERRSLAAGSEGKLLFDAEGRTRGKLTGSGSPSRPEFTVTLHDEAGRPLIVRRYDSGYGLVRELNVMDAIELLARHQRAAGGRLEAAGRLALPYLEAYAGGEIRAGEEADVVRARAAVIAGGMGSPRAFSPLVRLLSEARGDRVDGVSVEAVRQALLYLPPSESARFRDALSSESAEVRAVSAQFLSYHAGARDEEPLKRRLSDESVAVRRYAALALGKLRSPAALEPLMEVARCADATLARRAAIHLATYPDAEAVAFLRESLSDPKLARNTAEGASRSNDPSMAAALRDLALSGSPPDALWRGLSRWGFRGERAGREGMAAGSLNPNAAYWVRQYLEAELVALDAPSRRALTRDVRALRGRLAEDAPRWQKDAFDAFLRCRALGIERPERIPPECMEEILSNRERPRRDGRPLVTFVYPRGDSNGAFYGGSQMIADLVSNGYRVMYYEVETDRQLAAALRHASGPGTRREQKASIIVLGGHGTPTTIHLERDSEPLPRKRGYLDTGDGALLRRKRVGEMLADGGLVLVESCHGGSGGASGRNMANFAREIFPQAAPDGIWSVVTSYCESTLVFDEDGKVVDVIYDVPDYRARSDAPGATVASAASFFERKPLDSQGRGGPS